MVTASQLSWTSWPLKFERQKSSATKKRGTYPLMSRKNIETMRTVTLKLCYKSFSKRSSSKQDRMLEEIKEKMLMLNQRSTLTLDLSS